MATKLFFVMAIFKNSQITRLLSLHGVNSLLAKSTIFPLKKCNL